MKNVSDFIRFALSHADPATVPSGAKLPYPVGDAGVWEYLWGTSGWIATKSLLDEKFKSYYSKNGWSRSEFDSVTKGWVENKVRVTDCQGLLDSFLKNDTSANGNYINYCTRKGLVAAMNEPFVIGEAVFMGTAKKKTHVGWVCGFLGTDPLVVEARGTKYGVVVTRMSKRKWEYRGLMTKKFSYENAKPQEEPKQYVFKRELKLGCKGDDVVKLKVLLVNAGYSKGITINTASSPKYGTSTRRIVREYQRDNGLTVDGVAGRKTIESLGGKFE